MEAMVKIVGKRPAAAVGWTLLWDPVVLTDTAFFLLQAGKQP